jgi:hypothetical protein
MPVEIGESRAGAAKESRDMSYERKVPTVAFMECVKVHDVKLADIDRHDTVFVEIGREEVLPPPLEDGHARAVIPTCMPHPAQARWVALDDNVLCGLGILEIRVNLHKTRLRKSTWRKSRLIRTIPIPNPMFNMRRPDFGIPSRRRRAVSCTIRWIIMKPFDRKLN